MTCFIFAKRICNSIVATCFVQKTKPTLPHQGCGRAQKSKRLHVCDFSTNLVFFVDSGSKVSTFPCKPNHAYTSSSHRLVAANGTAIRIFGKVNMTLDLHLRVPIKLKFCAAKVPYPIIRADLLAHYGLLIEFEPSKLSDSLTASSISFFGGLSLVGSHTISKLLAEFPEIIGAKPFKLILSSKIFHHIIISGPFQAC